jgi:sortase A
VTAALETMSRTSRPPADDDAPSVPGKANETSPRHGQADGASALRLSPFRHAARATLITLTGLSLAVALQALFVSGLQHRAAQVRAFATLRDRLAHGTAPIGQSDANNHLLPLGTPVALIDVPSVHIHEVVGEGTTSGVLMSGPGHRRDTPLPGQAGTSVIFGRKAAYGGPFRRLNLLRKGAKITITTGQGVSNYRVIDHRRAGDPAPPAPAAGKGRLQLVTADGTSFVPSGVFRVDADLDTPTLDSAPGRGGLPKPEQPLANDPSTAWALVLWLQALIALCVGAVWAWVRWGRFQTWIVFVPLIALAGLAAVGQLFRLLPNLL